MATDRTALARRLIKLRKIYAPYKGEDHEICAQLKKDAVDNGGNFQVVIDKQGRIKVSAPHDKRFKGKSWELDVEAFLQASATTRKSLLSRGIVKEVDEYSGAYYGAVEVELFP